MEKTISKPSEAERARWFSTGFLASGVGAVMTDQHMLKDAAVIRVGEARGHEMWVDQEMCNQVMLAANKFADKGLKSRFGHPDMCSDALGTFLGRWKTLKAGPDGIVRGDLFLSSTAAESPKGDLRNYIEQMAAKEPGHFGTSIVFSRDWETEADFIVANGGEYVFWSRTETGTQSGRTQKKADIPEGADWWVDESGFKSPDPSNVNNYRHARLAALHAADLVDDPAATDGMFSGAGGAALAARTSEWLDTHPEVLSAFAKDPEMLGILERYAEQVRPFVERYSANHPLTAPAEPAAANPPEASAPAEPDAALTARIAELESLLKAGAENLERAQGDVKQLTADKDGLTEQLATARTELDAAKQKADALTKERDEAQQKLAALQSGQPPVSGTAAPADDQPADFWSKVRRNGKRN